MGPTNNDKVLAKAESISIPTEPIGSIPRPIDLIERAAESVGEDPNLSPLYKAAIRDTLSGLKRRTLRTVVLVGQSSLPLHALHEARPTRDYVE